MRVTKIMAFPALSLVSMACAGCVDMGFTAADYHPQIEPANYQASVDNPYFPLIPGTLYKYIETADGERSENVITVTHETKTIMGVKCVVVHDTVMKDGVLTEDTYDWFAQDNQGTVWYFGEDTKEYKPGGQVSTEGSWEGGVNGALPGIIMPGQPKPGNPYYQEYERGQAEDMGQIVALDDSVKAPFGSFSGSVRTKEWSMLESGSENKWYVKGIGVVRTESTAGEVAVLVSMTHEK